MTDQIASLVVEVDASGAKKAAVDLDSLTKAADRADAAANDLEGSTRKLSAAEKTVADEAKRAMGAFNGLAGEQEALARTQDRLNSLHGTAIKNTGALNQATLNLGRQFTDIGTSLSSGMSPLMVAVQQGPQIVDIFAQLKTQGVGAGAAFQAMGAALAPAVPLILGIGAAVGVVVGGFALFERAVDKQTKNATTFGDTWKAVLKVTGDYIMDGPIGDGLKWLGKAFNSTLDAITAIVAGGAVKIAGFFGASYLAVVNNWKRLPEVVGVILQNAANAAIKATEWLINKGIDGINALGKKFGFAEIGKVALGTFKSASTDIAKQFDADQKRIEANLIKGGKDFLSRVAAESDKYYEKRQKGAKAAQKATEEHTKAILANNDAYRAADDGLTSYLAKLNEEIATMGMSSEQLRRREAEQMALAADTPQLAEFVRQLAKMYEDQARVGKEAAEVQKAIGAAANDNIKTIQDATIGLDDYKRSLEEVSWAYARAFRSAGDFFGAVASGDVGGSIGGLSNLLKDASKLSSGGLGKALGKAGAFLGPVGEAVSAVTGVLGIIGQKSAEKAQAKLDALSRGVDDLRAANVTSSASIKGALDEANKAWNADLEYTSQMVTSLRSIDSQIGSLAVAVSNSITTGNLLSTSGLGLGTSGSGAGGLLGAVGALLFGNTKTSTTLLDQGLAFNPGTYAQGVTGSTYADLATTKTKSLLGVAYSTKVSNSTVSGSLNGELLSQVNAVIKALGDGVLSAASVFGSEAAKAAESALGSAVVDLGKLSLKDLKPDEIAAVLQATFDKVGDQLAAAGVPGLDKLGQVGEGAFETLTRVAREYQVVDVALASIGKTFGAVGLESLAARDGLVQLLGGVEEFSSKTGFFAANFLTDAERLAPIQKAVNDNLAAYGLSAASTRDQFKSLVLAQDLTTESGRSTYAALLNIAPAFDKVAKASEAATAAADELAKQTADQQRQEAEAKIAKAKEVADAQASIQDRIDQLTKTSAELMYAGRRKELDAADALDASLGPLLVKLYGLEDAATKAAERTAKAADVQSNQTTNIGLMRQLMAMDDAVTGATSARDAMRADELAKLDATGQYLQKIIWAREDEQKVIDANTADLEAANARRAELTNRQTSIQDQIDQLTLSSADLLLKTRAKERAEAVAFDASLGGLLDSLYSLQDASKAASAAMEAEAERIARAKEVADYQASIQDRIDELTLSSSDLLLKTRNKETAAAAAYGEAAVQLLRQLYALEDASKAAAAAAQAQAEAQQAAAEAQRQAEEVAQRAAELQSARQAKLADLLDAQGQGEAARMLRRAQELASITDPVLNALQQQLYIAEDAAQRVSSARDVLTKAYEREQSALTDTKAKFADMAKTLRAFSGSISSAVAAASSPINQRGVAEAAFLGAANRARLGDAEAMALLPGLGEAFKEASLASAKDQITYLRDLATIASLTDAAAETATRQETLADQQLKALKAQVSGLIDVEEATVDVTKAVANLQAALVTQAAGANVTQIAALNEQLSALWDLNKLIAAVDGSVRVSGVTTTQALVTIGAQQVSALSNLASIGNNIISAINSLSTVFATTTAATPRGAVTIAANDDADTAAAKALYLSATSGIDVATFNKYLGSSLSEQVASFNRIGWNGDPEALRKKYGFATGGSFMVGGSGPPDSQVFPLHLSPGEMVNVSRPGESGNAEMIAELRALRQEVSELKAAQIQTTINTGRQVRLAERWDGDGLPPERDAA